MAVSRKDLLYRSLLQASLKKPLTDLLLYNSLMKRLQSCPSFSLFSEESLFFGFWFFWWFWNIQMFQNHPQNRISTFFKSSCVAVLVPALMLLPHTWDEFGPLFAFRTVPVLCDWTVSEMLDFRFVRWTQHDLPLCFMFTAYCHLFWPLSVKLKDDCGCKFQQIISFWNIHNSLSSMTTHHILYIPGQIDWFVILVNREFNWCL